MRILLSPLLFLLLGCSETDPGTSISHIHIGQYIFDLTLGPIISVIVVPIIIWGVQFGIARKFREWDALTKATLSSKYTLDMERHKHLTDTLEENKNLVVTKMDSICERFDKVDKRFYNHGHTIRMNSDGTTETRDIVIRQSVAEGI